MDDLVKGVDAGVGTTCAHDQWFMFEAKCFRQRGAKLPHDGVVLGLVREATKSLAVIGQVEAPALRGA